MTICELMVRLTLMAESMCRDEIALTKEHSKVNPLSNTDSELRFRGKKKHYFFHRRNSTDFSHPDCT